jgi:hypothetical protein
MRRAGACGQSTGKIMFMMLWFALSLRLESVHAVEGGFFRLKFRRDRRPGLPIAPPLVFYVRYGLDIIRKHLQMAYWLIRMGWFSRRVKADPNRGAYADASLQPADTDHPQTLDRHNALNRPQSRADGP